MVAYILFVAARHPDSSHKYSASVLTSMDNSWNLLLRYSGPAPGLAVMAYGSPRGPVWS